MQAKIDSPSQLSTLDSMHYVYAERANRFNELLSSIDIDLKQAQVRINSIFGDWSLNHTLNNYFQKVDDGGRDFCAPGSEGWKITTRPETDETIKIYKYVPLIFSRLLNIPEKLISAYCVENPQAYKDLTLYIMALVSGKAEFIVRLESTLQYKFRLPEQSRVSFAELSESIKPHIHEIQDIHRNLHISSRSNRRSSISQFAGVEG